METHIFLHFFLQNLLSEQESIGRWRDLILQPLSSTGIGRFMPCPASMKREGGVGAGRKMFLVVVVVKGGGGVWERGIWNVEGESRMVNGAPLRLLRPLPLHQAIFFSVKQAPQPENKTSSEPRPPLEKTQQAHASSEKLYTL